MRNWRSDIERALADFMTVAELVGNMALTVAAEYSKLNNFKMFLALSDRLAKNEGEFLRLPHTTKLMWGSHHVIYVFSNVIGDLSL